ncbi:MAG TPA: hypothetical protein VKB79_11465 [Bryobacteraceae bacterium]|nr:hypothetical protein [Bryobacteraceae bacterium]
MPRSPAIAALTRVWNWKAALTSSLIRGAIFFFSNLRAGWHAALGAMIAEWIFRGVGSGFYGRLTERFSRFRSAWQRGIAGIVALPVLSHSLEYAVHRLRHTPALRTSITASVVFTMLSSLFHLYAMRRGALITGKGARSLAADMRAMPRLIAGFVAFVPLLIMRRVAAAAQAS